MIVQKPKSNIYTALLGIAALALTIGAILLYTEIYRHTPAGTSYFNFMAVFGAVKGGG